MSKLLKNTLLGLGGVTIAIVPALAVVSCSSSLKNPQDEIFGGKEGTIQGLKDYFIESKELQAADDKAKNELAGLKGLTLDKELMKKMNQITYLSYELVAKSVKIPTGYKMINGSFVNDSNGDVPYYVGASFNVSQLTTADQAYFVEPSNWKEKPTPEQSFQDFLDEVQTGLNESKKGSLYAGSFKEAKIRDLGLLNNLQELVRIEQDTNRKENDGISISDKGELVVSFNETMAKVNSMQKSLDFQRKLGYDKINDATQTSWTQAEKDEFIAINKEVEDMDSSKNVKFNTSAPLTIAQETTSVIKEITLVNTSLALEAFNAKPIADKLNDLKITFTDSIIDEINIKDIVAALNGKNWDLTITWNDVLSSQFSSGRASEALIALPDGMKLYKSGFSKWNDVLTTSTKAKITIA